MAWAKCSGATPVCGVLYAYTLCISRLKTYSSTCNVYLCLKRHNYTAIAMGEVASGSQDGVSFWDAKTFDLKRRTEPFPDSHSVLSSLSWGANSIRQLTSFSVLIPPQAFLRVPPSPPPPTYRPATCDCAPRWKQNCTWRASGTSTNVEVSFA